MYRKNCPIDSNYIVLKLNGEKSFRRWFMGDKLKDSIVKRTDNLYTIYMANKTG